MSISQNVGAVSAPVSARVTGPSVTALRWYMRIAGALMLLFMAIPGDPSSPTLFTYIANHGPFIIPALAAIAGSFGKRVELAGRRDARPDVGRPRRDLHLRRAKWARARLRDRRCRNRRGWPCRSPRSPSGRSPATFDHQAKTRTLTADRSCPPRAGGAVCCPGACSLRIASVTTWG